MSNMNKTVSATLNCIEHFLALVFAATGCISFSVFPSQIDIPTGFLSSKIGLNICATITEIKKYKLIIKKKKRKHHEIASLAKNRLNCMKGFIPRSLIDSISNVSKEHDDTKEEIYNLETS